MDIKMEEMGKSEITHRNISLKVYNLKGKLIMFKYIHLLRFFLFQFHKVMTKHSKAKIGTFVNLLHSFFIYYIAIMQENAP